MRLTWWPWQKQIGWQEIGEDFIRYTLLATPLLTIYLHRLVAPGGHCHDHPWDFFNLVIWPGYWEITDACRWVKAGTVRFVRAEFQHKVITEGVSWSLIITGPKRREWSIKEDGCG